MERLAITVLNVGILLALVFAGLRVEELWLQVWIWIAVGVCALSTLVVIGRK